MRELSFFESVLIALLALMVGVLTVVGALAVRSKQALESELETAHAETARIVAEAESAAGERLLAINKLLDYENRLSTCVPLEAGYVVTKRKKTSVRVPAVDRRRTPVFSHGRRFGE